MNSPQPPLDDKGLPLGYDFQPDWEVTPRYTKQRLDAKADVLLIDCRLPHEWQITHIDGVELIPLQQLQELYAQRLKGQEHREVIVHCRSGARSLKFVQALRQVGFKNAKSMAGGILLWNRDVNPGGPQY